MPDIPYNALTITHKMLGMASYSKKSTEEKMQNKRPFFFVFKQLEHTVYTVQGNVDLVQGLLSYQIL